MRPAVFRNTAAALIGMVLSGMTATAVGGVPDQYLVAQAQPSGLDDSLGFNMQELTDKEKLKYANEAQDEMREYLTSLEKNLDDARKAKDIVFLNCLNEKFSNINALLKVTETATILMQEAINQSSSQRVDRQFRKVYIARLKARQLQVAASECTKGVGEGLEITGETEPTIQYEYGLGDDSEDVPGPYGEDDGVGVDPVEPPPVCS